MDTSKIERPGFLDAVRQLTRLDEDAATDLSDMLQTKVFRKGDFVLKQQEICKYLYFIDGGLLKLFFSSEDKTFIMRFFPEGSMFTLLDSYLTQSQAQYEIVALEPATLTFIRYDDLEVLCKRYHTVETFFRKLISMAALNMMSRVSEMLEEDATARYENFVQQNNTLMQRISLGDLAAYLGITQVSLSRIRAKR